MILTYQYRLLPTKAQHRALERILEDQRQLYNAALQERIECYRKTGRGRTYIDQSLALTECRRIVPEMSGLPVSLQRGTLRKLDRAYAAFFRRIREGEKAGFPRFKGKDWFKSFAFGQWIGLRLTRNRVRFKGIPGGLRLHLHRPLPDAEPTGCIFKRDSKGWTVSLQYPLTASPKRPVERVVGMDLGLKTLAALSDGSMIPNPRCARRAERGMRRRQRQLARSVRGSKRRLKAKTRLSRLHAKVANTRRTYLHQKSAMLVKNYDLIAIEALNVQALSRTFLARSVHDASWGIMIDLIRYKAERAGAHLIEVDPKRTSQECPNCGVVVAKTLAERVHSCPCGCVLDRDVAAAKVILKRAVAGPWLGNVTHVWGERGAGNIGTSRGATPASRECLLQNEGR